MLEITLTSKINGAKTTYGANPENKYEAWEAAVEFAKATNQTVSMIDWDMFEKLEWLGD